MCEKNVKLFSTRAATKHAHEKGRKNMKLDLTAIKSITHGAVNVYEEDGVFKFAKCTESQVAAWYKYGSDVLGYRAETTTGIRLDFYTDSKTFSFKTASGDKFELLIDGMLRERYTKGEDAFIEKTVKLTDPLGKEKDELRVSFIFPSHSVGALRYVELDDGAYLRAPEYKTKMLFIGDSITQGHNTKYDSLSYAWRTVRYFDADAVINGIGGAYYMPESFDKIDFEPDTVILAYGTNDACKFDYATMTEKTVGYLDLVKEHYGDKNVIVLSPIWRARDTGAVMGEDFENKRKMVEDEAEKRGFRVISGLKLVPPVADFFADKYLHPNDLGFGVYAENLIKELSTIIK